MLDYGFVTSRLAVGAHLGGQKERVEELQRAGFTHVVNAQSEEDDGAILAGTGIEYLRVPTPDDHGQKPVEWFQKVIEFTLGALNKPKTKVYIHCAAGISRSTSLTYAVLRAWGFDSNTAARLVIIGRPKAELNYRQNADDAVRILGYTDGF